METAATDQKPSLTKFGMIWLFSLFGIVPLVFALGWFDDFTLLTPHHDGATLLGFVIPIALGLVSVAVAITQARYTPAWRRAGMAFGFGLMTLIVSFMAVYLISDLIIGRIDFPPGKTKTFKALMLISRAYHTRHWNIQTMPVWSNMDITKEDYKFMLAHRRPGDNGNDPNEISSRGHFCASVTMEQSGQALRVLHAGRRTLPKGTVILCPPGYGGTDRE